MEKIKMDEALSKAAFCFRHPVKNCLNTGAFS